MLIRAPYKMHIFISIMPISSPNHMFDHLLESSNWEDSNKWSNIWFGKEITKVEWIEVFMHFANSVEYDLTVPSGFTLFANQGPIYKELTGWMANSVHQVWNYNRNICFNGLNNCTIVQDSDQSGLTLQLFQS